MRIVVLIFAVLSLLGATLLGVMTQIRANHDVADAKEIFEKMEAAKAEAEKDESAKMKYEFMQEALERSGAADLTPGRISTWGYCGLFTALAAVVTLIFVFTKKDSITMILGIAVIALAVITYFVAPSMPESTGMFARASFKSVSMSLLVPGVFGGGLAILATKLRKPTAVA